MKLSQWRKAEASSRKRRRLRLYQIFNRNTVLFVGGLLGTAHETLLEHAERPTLLVLFAAMMGLPAFLSPGINGGIEQRQRNRKEIEDEDNKENENKNEKEDE
jgi:hypothetical protein